MSNVAVGEYRFSVPTDLPRTSGVYLVCVRRTGEGPASPERILYAGSAINIRRRIANPGHPYQALRARFRTPFIVYLRIRECEDFRREEVRMIHLLRPMLNTKHNG